MPQIDETTLKKHIKNKMFEKVYFIYGDESFLKQHYVNELAKQIVTGAEDFNLVRFNGKGLKIDALSDAVIQLPFMSEKRCVIVNDFDAENANANELEKLKELLSDLPDATVLIFWQDIVPFSYKKPGKLKTAITLINKNGATAEFPRKDDVSLAKIIIKSASKRGCTIDNAIARYMVSVCGNDLQNLQTELDKLCSYKMNAAITKEDIDFMVTKSVEARTFDFSKAILSRDADRAFKLLDELFYMRIEPVVILSAVISNYVDVCRAKAAISAGLRAEQVAKDFGYRGTEFRLRNGAVIASRMSENQIKACLDELEKADRMLKSSPVDNRVTLEQMTVNLLKI